MDNVSVRALEHAQWQDLFEIRLEAVTKHPNYFLSSPEKTKELSGRGLETPYQKRQ